MDTSATETFGQLHITRFAPSPTGELHLGNARTALFNFLLARHAAAGSGLPALADDSGIEVDALDGRPGVWSARYAGAQASDTDNLALLLHQLAGVPEARRSARYRCVLVFVRNASDPDPVIGTGVWEGRVLTEARGTGGFGYDPLFQPAGFAITAAEMPAAQKNILSHRAQALRALLATLP